MLYVSHLINHTALHLYMFITCMVTNAYNITSAPVKISKEKGAFLEEKGKLVHVTSDYLYNLKIKQKLA